MFTSAGERIATDCSPSEKLHLVFTRYLSGRLPPPLGLHIGTALLSLARLPTMHTSSLIPPLLLSSSEQHPLSEQALDQALLEGEVYMHIMCPAVVLILCAPTTGTSAVHGTQ